MTAMASGIASSFHQPGAATAMAMARPMTIQAWASSARPFHRERRDRGAHSWGAK
jgi:hypothetical protein